MSDTRRALTFDEFVKLSGINDAQALAIWSTVANLGRAIALLTAPQAKRECFTLGKLAQAVLAGPARLCLDQEHYNALRQAVNKLRSADQA